MLKSRVFFISAILLLLLALRFLFVYKNKPHYTDGQHINFETTLFSEPQIFGNYQTLSANLGAANRLFIKTSVYPKFHYQDTVRISGNIKFQTLENKRTIMIMYFPKIEAGRKDKNPLLSLAGSIRQKVIVLFSKTLPSPASSLMLGIVFGIKESLPGDFADNLRISGVLHVVAASGMNVSMVGSFFSSIFAFFLKRQIAVLATIMAIIFYAILSGLDPSIIRASIMGILVFASQILGRQSLASFGLFLAGFIMLYLNPLVIFDVGFQLSFLATAGLLYLKRILVNGKMAQIVLKRSIIGEDVATTVAAQLATLPILLASFGTYSIWSIVANGLVLWTIVPLMMIGGIGSMLGIIVEPVGKAILYLSIPFLFYFQKVVEAFGEVGEMIRLNQLPWQFAVGYYILLTLVIISFNRGIKL